jgi:hypothetical protein
LYIICTLDVRQVAFTATAKVTAKAKTGSRVRGGCRGKKESSGESDSSNESEVSGMDENVFSDDSMGNSDISERDVKHLMKESGMDWRNAVRWLKKHKCFRGRYSKPRWDLWESMKDMNINWSKYWDSISSGSDGESSSNEISLGGCRTAAKSRAERALLRGSARKRGVQDYKEKKACFSMICF